MSRAAPLIGLLAALLLALPAFAPWLDPRLDLSIYRVDDAKNHLVRLYHFGWLIERGVLYPRWVPDMFMGYGYPLLSFYAPGYYYVALVTGWLFRLDTWDTLRYGGLIAALVGTGGAYALTYTLWRRVLPALFAALALAYGPYVFQVNLWRRAALPETQALSLIPWLLLAIHRLWHAERPAHRLGWSAAVTGIGAALFLSHNLTALAAFAMAGVWTLMHLISQRSWQPLISVGIAVALALSLSSFFWLSAIGEGRLVQLEELWSTGGLDWRGWFVEPTGWTDKDQKPDNRQTAYGWIDRNLHYPHQLIAAPKISLAQTGLGLMTGGVLLVAMGRRRASDDHLQPIATLYLIALVCWFLTFSVSQWLWELIPALPLFQFPWRFLGPGGIALSVASAGALAWTWDAAQRRWGARRGAVIGTLAVTLAGAAFLFNSLGAKQPPFAEKPDRRIDGRYVVADETRDYVGVGTTTNREFLPRDVQVAVYTPGMPRHIGVFEWLYPDLDWLGGLLRPLNPSRADAGADLRFLGWRVSPLRISARVANDSPQPGLLGVRQLRFAGWRAWLDGKRAEIRVPDYVPEQQMTPGFMVLEIPPGEHTVDLAFGPSPLRLAALGVTLASAVGAAGLLAWLLRRSGRSGGRPLVLVAAAVGVLLVTYGCWRAARPMFGRFAALPIPPPQRSAATGAWAAPDLSGPYGAGLVVNLAEAVRSGHAQISSPTGPTLGPDRYVDVRFLTIVDADPLRGTAGASRRQWLYLHPPSSVSVDVTLPPRGQGRQLWLQAGIALDPGMWNAPLGDGVRFQVSVSPLAPPAGGPQGVPGTTGATGTTVLDETINPRATAEHRKFVPVVADLTPWAGTTVRLTLSTHPRDELSFDWAGWANPVVTVIDSARDPLSRLIRG